jgi:hypothetical protein
MLLLAPTTDLYKVAEEHRKVTGDRLTVYQKSLHIRQKEHDQKLSNQQAKCLQLFRLTKSTEDATYEWYKDRTVDRVEGTCMWFPDYPYFQEWR